MQHFGALNSSYFIGPKVFNIDTTKIISEPHYDNSLVIWSFNNSPNDHFVSWSTIGHHFKFVNITGLIVTRIRSLIGASQQSIHRDFNLDIPQQISYDKWFDLLYDIISKIVDDILREKYEFLSINRHEIHDMITRIVKDVIKKSSESETRLVPNYALLSSGARIIPHLTSSEYVGYPDEFVKRQVLKMFNIKPTQSKPAKIVLTSNNEAGNCFCFTGTHGQLAVHLSHNIKVTSITYEHLNPTLALDPDDMRRAPKTFEIVGISVDSQEKHDEYIQLGSFDYKLDGPPAQSFEINLQNLDLLPVMKAVILKIMGNWGDELTCLYQVKVHGYVSKKI
ncbi:28560_t:CDS:2 [Gigaspora margarita]|uniref:28560_t:CDS:1 n=1 Tax=Gigaspora margarita TaxID=4874 RepID=A0ABN7VVJ2_GIGMA|nr:28560_t:CDS:2 [Gigaspora margarita]